MRMLAMATAGTLIFSGVASAQIRPVPAHPPVATRPMTPSPASPPLRSPSFDPPPTPAPDLNSGQDLCSEADVLAGRCTVVARLPRCPGPDPRCPRPSGLNPDAGDGGPQP